MGKHTINNQQLLFCDTSQIISAIHCLWLGKPLSAILDLLCLQPENNLVWTYETLWHTQLLDNFCAKLFLRCKWWCKELAWKFNLINDSSHPTDTLYVPFSLWSSWLIVVLVTFRIIHNFFCNYTNDQKTSQCKFYPCKETITCFSFFFSGQTFSWNAPHEFKESSNRSRVNSVCNKNISWNWCSCLLLL